MTGSSVHSILIVCNRVPYPLKDGGAMAMYALIDSWQKLGKKVHLLAMNTSRHYVDPQSLPPLFSQLASCNLVDVDNTITWKGVLRNLLFSSKPEHAERFYNESFQKVLTDTVIRCQPDIIQLESIYLHEYVAELRKHSRGKIVQRLHNIEYQLWQRLADETSSFLKKYYLNILSTRLRHYEQKVWQESDALLPISGQDEDIIKQSVKTPIHTLPFGLRLSSENPEYPVKHDFRKAYHIGAMDWLPNQEAIEWLEKEIMSGVRKEISDFEFHFAGRNMPLRFRSMPESGFFCHGEVENASTFATNKSILLVPLKAASGIRIKTLEAMAHSKLVISTRVGMQGIEAIRGKHFLEANTADEFTKAIIWAVKHPEKAAAIAGEAREWVLREHDQEKLMLSVAGFVEKLAQDTPVNYSTL